MQGTLCDDIKGNKHDRVLIFLFYLLQTQLDESQIDAAFKNLFRQLAGPVSAFLSLQEINETLDKHLTVFYFIYHWQDMEISITELQTILNRIISKREQELQSSL